MFQVVDYFPSIADLSQWLLQRKIGSTPPETFPPPEEEPDKVRHYRRINQWIKHSSNTNDINLFFNDIPQHEPLIRATSSPIMKTQIWPNHQLAFETLF